MIGYARAAEVTHEATRSGVPVRELLVRKGIVREDEVDQVFDPRRLTDPHGEDA